MKVYKKLIEARNLLQSKELKKTGNNKFAGYQYFELGDFLPAIQSIFLEVGLVDVIRFNKEEATMTLICIEDGSSVVFTSPMGSANLKGCHEVQNIGAVETYQRRYLYVTAMAIVEHDALDSSEPLKETKPDTKPIEANRPEPKITAKISSDTLSQIEQLIKETNADVEKLLNYYKKEKLMFLSVSEGTNVLNQLKIKKEQQNGIGK